MNPEDSSPLGAWNDLTLIPDAAVTPDEYTLAFLRSLSSQKEPSPYAFDAVQYLGGVAGWTVNQDTFASGITARDRDLFAGSGIRLE